MLMESRNFQPISVGKCYAQTATDRFGDGAKAAVRDRELVTLGLHPQNTEVPFVWPPAGSDSDDERHSGTSIYRLIPSMQKFRGNLTALSKVYNLYFSAYQGRIFVYRPRAAPSQSLPSQPDLQLKPKASDVAQLVGGAVDVSRPHTINHMIIGFLGDEEIVLACYDDGDVVAYYTKDLAKRIFTGRGTSDVLHKSAPEQFFHENAGISAWGLSIHQKSRLIAVSSNHHEVVVFALALTQNPPNRRTNIAITPQPAMQTRTRNWRIVIRLPPAADNIPNICFIDDCHGNAQRVGAVDIKGNLWLADIWQGNTGPIQVRPLSGFLIRSEEFYPALSRGWGVFALDERDFLKVQTKEELFGIPQNQIEIVPAGNGCGQQLVNIRKALSEIPDNPHLAPFHMPAREPIVLGPGAGMPLPWTPALFQTGFAMPDGTGLGSDGSDIGEDELEDTEESEGDSEGSEIDMEADLSIAPDWSALNHTQVDGSLPGNLYGWDARLNQEDRQDGKEDTDQDASGNSANPHNLDMTYFPHSNTVHPTPRSALKMIAFVRSGRSIERNRHPLTSPDHLEDLGKKLFMLRTYEKDIELRSFTPRTSENSPPEFGVICPDALTFGRFRNVGLRGHFHATSRMNMIAMVPELSLMVIGSPIGRVVLITLTRKARTAEHDQGSWEHGFRVEWVLPTKSDEDKHRKVKNLRPLHGMALGPVQVGDDVGGKVGGGGPAMPRRYRLMLHYRNHDILSYELTREEQTGKLCIF